MVSATQRLSGSVVMIFPLAVSVPFASTAIFGPVWYVPFAYVRHSYENSMFVCHYNASRTVIILSSSVVSNAKLD
ncbi:MAG: hypothetical protein H8F28_11075 [Fibrella sp.]|nr:hypothetical protein [Armatimonadota bacterium]